MGDEGKGKIVDVLNSKYDIIARFKEIMQDTL
jgi:adenylosuccinate synthase